MRSSKLLSSNGSKKPSAAETVISGYALVKAAASRTTSGLTSTAVTATFMPRLRAHFTIATPAFNFPALGVANKRHEISVLAQTVA